MENIRISYENSDEREEIIRKHIAEGYVLIEEANTDDGDYLILSSGYRDNNEKQPEPTELELLQQENQMLKQQMNALSQQSEMLEGAIVELALITLE